MKVKVLKKLKSRIGTPSVNALYKNILLPGTIIEVEDEFVNGDFYEGNNKWYKGKKNTYYWSGGIKIIEQITPTVFANTISNDEIKPITISYTKVNNWWLQKYQIDELWKSTRGSGISIAVLGMGLNYNLAEFKNKTSITYYNAQLNSEMRVDCMDELGQSTNYTAVLCAMSTDFLGVAPEVTLNVIKVTDSAGKRSTETIRKGLERAIEMNSDIITIDFCIPIDTNFDKIHLLIKNAESKGIVVVAPAGNNGTLKFPVNNYPASFPECISVGSVDQNDKRSLSSTKSNFLNLMAPGEDLMQACSAGAKSNASDYATYFLAGIVALLLAMAKGKERKISIPELFEILEKTANKKIEGYNPLEYGWGTINPLASADLIRSV